MYAKICLSWSKLHSKSQNLWHATTAGWERMHNLRFQTIPKHINGYLHQHISCCIIKDRCLTDTRDTSRADTHQKNRCSKRRILTAHSLFSSSIFSFRHYPKTGTKLPESGSLEHCRFHSKASTKSQHDAVHSFLFWIHDTFVFHILNTISLFIWSYQNQTEKASGNEFYDCWGTIGKSSMETKSNKSSFKESWVFTKTQYTRPLMNYRNTNDVLQNIEHCNNFLW